MVLLKISFTSEMVWNDIFSGPVITVDYNWAQAYLDLVFQFNILTLVKNCLEVLNKNPGPDQFLTYTNLELDRGTQDEGNLGKEEDLG